MIQLNMNNQPTSQTNCSDKNQYIRKMALLINFKN